MYPVLFSILDVPVRAYGFFMSLAHLAGIMALLFSARAHRQPFAPFIDLIFAVTFFGVLGARAGYAFNNWAEFSADPISLLSLNKGGLSYFGGFTPAFIAFVAVLRWRKIPVLETSDYVSPILPFSLALIRLGCFGQGCCYGAPTSVAWAVHYTRLDSRVPPALLDRGLHPTQLYEAVFLIVLAAILYLAARRKYFPPGVLATFSIFAYALYRFLADSYRGDLTRGFWGVDWLGPTQGAALLGILATPIVLWICLRQKQYK